MEDKLNVSIIITKPDREQSLYNYNLYKMSWDTVKEVLELAETLEGMEG